MEQVVARLSWHSLPVPHPPINEALELQAAVEASLREEQAVHIETLIEPGAEDNSTTNMSAVGGPPTSTALSLLLDAPPMTVSTPPPALPHAILNEPAGNVKRRNVGEELKGLQEQVSQLKAKMRSQGLPHCTPDATCATIPSGDISETVLNLTPPEEFEVEQVLEDQAAVNPPMLEDQAVRIGALN